MRQKLVAGNWKMHGSRASVEALTRALLAGMGKGLDATDIVLCPPVIFIPAVERMLAGSALVLGAQNAASEAGGAFTGEVAPAMLKEFSVRYVIIGHSERRTLFAESDQVISNKFSAVLAESLLPILCVGETLQQRDNGEAKAIVSAQLETVLSGNPISAFATAVIAYEPVWAIGTGRTATVEQAQEMHRHIRALLATKDSGVAQRTRIIYGGSVNADNARKLFAQPDIDGGLVGGASLKAEEFIAICNSTS